MSVYSKELTTELVDAYTANPGKVVIDDFAAKHGLSPVSVRSKLVAEGVYQPQSKTKSKANDVRKSDVADFVSGKLRERYGVTLESLDRMRKDDLVALANSLAEETVE